MLPLKIWGQDATGKTFNQPAFTMDVTPNGARIGGVKQELKVGEVIGLARGATKTKCRVTWSAKHKNGLNEIGIELLEPQKNIWAVSLPKAQPDQFKGKRSASEMAAPNTAPSTQDAEASDATAKNEPSVVADAEPSQQMNPFAIVPPEFGTESPAMAREAAASAPEANATATTTSESVEFVPSDSSVAAEAASRASDEQETTAAAAPEPESQIATSDSEMQTAPPEATEAPMAHAADDAASHAQPEAPADEVQPPVPSVTFTPYVAESSAKDDSMPTHSTEKPLSIPQSVALPVADGAEPAVDQIRNILVGQHMHEFAARFAKLSDKIAREFADIRDIVRQRTEELERSSTRDTESLAVRLRAEENARIDLSKDSVRELKAAGDALSSKLGDLESSTSSADQDARKKQAAESSRLMDELSRTHDELQSMIRRQAADLRHSKVDRAVLADLLEDVVKQITSEDASSQNVAAALINNTLAIRPSSGVSARRADDDSAVDEQFSVTVESARRPVTSTDSAN